MAEMIPQCGGGKGGEVKRPSIEWYLQSVARCCGDKAGQRWCDIWSCGPIKSLCDYALALEKEKAELVRKLEAVRKAVDKDRFLCGLCVAMKADIEQALKEEL